MGLPPRFAPWSAVTGETRISPPVGSFHCIGCWSSAMAKPTVTRLPSGGARSSTFFVEADDASLRDQEPTRRDRLDRVPPAAKIEDIDRAPAVAPDADRTDRLDAQGPSSRSASAWTCSAFWGVSIPREVWRKRGVRMDATAFQSLAFQHASKAVAAAAVIASRRGSTTASGSGAGVGVGSRNEELSRAGVGEGVAGGGG